MSFANKTLTSAAWAFSTSYAVIIIAFGGNLLLARALVPEDFGGFALASSLLVFVTMITGFGSQEAILQCRDPEIEDLIPTAYWLSLAIGAGVACVGILLGIGVRPYYNNTIAYFVVLLSLLVPFTSISSAHSAVLMRDLNYRPIALTRTISIAFSYVFASVAALTGLGAWALLIRQGSEAIMFWLGMELVSPYHLHLVFNKTAARWIWNFGWKQMFSQISEVFFGRYDNLLIGTFLGEVQLGYYSHSYRLALLGQQFTQGALSPVLLPMFSTVQNSTEKLNYGFERVSYWIWRTVPLLGVLIYLFGNDLVVLLYGEKWTTAGHYFELLFLFFTFLPLVAILRSLLVGSGHINKVVQIKALQLIFFILGVSIGVFFQSIVAVIWVVNLNQVLAFLLMAHSAGRVIPIQWRYIGLAPALMFILTILVGQLLSDELLTAVDTLLVEGFFVIFLYALGLLILEAHSLRNELQIIFKAGWR